MPMRDKVSELVDITIHKKILSFLLFYTIKEAQQPALWPLSSISPRALLCSCLMKVVPGYLSQTHFFCLQVLVSTPGSTKDRGTSASRARQGIALHSR